MVKLKDLKKDMVLKDRHGNRARWKIVHVNEYGVFTEVPGKPDMKDFLSIEAINREKMEVEKT